MSRPIELTGTPKLPEEIQRTLPGLDDQRANRYFSERRLRPLLMIPGPDEQVRKFNRMLERVQTLSSTHSATDARIVQKIPLATHT